MYLYTEIKKSVYEFTKSKKKKDKNNKEDEEYKLLLSDLYTS